MGGSGRIAYRCVALEEWGWLSIAELPCANDEGDKGLKRRLSWLLAAASMLLLVLAGCGGGSVGNGYDHVANCFLFVGGVHACFHYYGSDFAMQRDRGWDGKL